MSQLAGGRWPEPDGKVFGRGTCAAPPAGGAASAQSPSAPWVGAHSEGVVDEAGVHHRLCPLQERVLHRHHMLLCGGGTVGSLHAAILQRCQAAGMPVRRGHGPNAPGWAARKLLDSPTCAACALCASLLVADGLLLPPAACLCGRRAATGERTARLSCMLSCMVGLAAAPQKTMATSADKCPR